LLKIKKKKKKKKYRKHGALRDASMTCGNRRCLGSTARSLYPGILLPTLNMKDIHKIKPMPPDQIQAGGPQTPERLRVFDMNLIKALIAYFKNRGKEGSSLGAVALVLAYFGLSPEESSQVVDLLISLFAVAQWLIPNDAFQRFLGLFKGQEEDNG